jgi:hypothetical protein
VLNSQGDESPGPTDWTTVRTAGDEIINPDESSLLEGATNILVQEVCPGRQTNHGQIPFDAVSFAVLLDALANPGPANPDRLPTSICNDQYAPGLSPAQIEADMAALLPAIIDRLFGQQVARVPAEPPVRAFPSVVGGVATAAGDGVWVGLNNGAVRTVAGAPHLGDAAGARLNAPVVGIDRTADGGGYWLLGRDGGVFTYGNAVFHGSTGDLRLNEPVVSLASDPRGRGYHFVAADGGVFSFGAPFQGSASNIRLAQPMVGVATTTSGEGYWLVARDGGLFSYGDAPFSGSTSAIPLNQPVVGMAADPDGVGYWLVAADGGVFSFDAAFHGSPVGRGWIGANDRVVGITAHPAGGYFLITASGGVIGFGAAAEVASPPS